MSIDIGLTHIALNCNDINESILFYKKYAKMEVVHQRTDQESGMEVVWLSDKTRPFVIVLASNHQAPDTVLKPFSHLGIGCKSTQHVDELCSMAKDEGILVKEPMDSGYPIGYWAFISDPDGHTLEVSYGQEIGLTTSDDE